MSQPQPPVPHAGGSRLTSHLVVHVATSYECSSNTWTVRTVPQRTGTQLHVHGYASQVAQQVTSVPQPAQEPPWDPDAPWLRMQSNSVSGDVSNACVSQASAHVIRCRSAAMNGETVAG